MQSVAGRVAGSWLSPDSHAPMTMHISTPVGSKTASAVFCDVTSSRNFEMTSGCCSGYCERAVKIPWRNAGDWIEKATAPSGRTRSNRLTIDLGVMDGNPN